MTHENDDVIGTRVPVRPDQINADPLVLHRAVTHSIETLGKHMQKKGKRAKNVIVYVEVEVMMEDQ